MPLALLSVFVGGILGTTLRAGIDAALPADPFPLGTLIVNTLGSLALGVLIGCLPRRAPEWLRSGLGVGLLGSFTTLSAVALSVTTLGVSGEWLIAIGYLAATLVLGLTAALLGIRLGASGTTIDWSNE